MRPIDVFSNVVARFFFFLVMLQISPQRLRRAFKKYPDGKLTREQCSELLRTLRKNTQAGARQANRAKANRARSEPI